MYDDYAKIRDSRGLNDTQVSKRTGIPRAAFSDWKAGRSVPKFDKLKAIAECLCVSVLTLMGEQEPLDLMDENEKVLIEEYRRENSNGRLHLLAYALLLMKEQDKKER